MNKILNENYNSLSEEQFRTLNEIYEEYQKGMLALNSLPSKTVTFYGGAKIGIDSSVYENTKTLAMEFAKRGWGVVSGGGPGVMAASLEGASLGGGKAVSFRIQLSDEQPAFKTPDVDILFHHFVARKYVLRQSDVLIYCPGGLGTLDELMENLTLIKTKKYPVKPLFLLDSKFWEGYVDWFDKILLTERKVVTPESLDLFKLVDSPQEVIQQLFE
jgi:uncharacterized protein (TIGR00730 family)